MRPSSRLILPPFRNDEKAHPGLETINNRAAGYFIVDSDLQEYPNKVPGTSDVMKRGSTTGVDTNDPEVHGGGTEPLFYFPGVLGNFARGTNTATESVTTSLALIIDYGPTGFVTGLGTRYYEFGNGSSANMIQILSSATGVRVRAFSGLGLGTSGTLTTTQTVPAGTRYVRAVAEVGVGVYTSYSTDGTSWTDGTAVDTVTAGTTASNRLYLGEPSYSAVSPLDINVAGLSLEVDGTEVRRVHAADVSSQTSWTSIHGDACEMVRPSTGLKVVRVAAGKHLGQTDGTDDYFELPTSCKPTTGAITGEFTALITMRKYGTSGAVNRRFISSEGGGGSTHGLTLYTPDGSTLYSYYHGGTSGIVDAGPTMVDSSVTTIGLKHVTGSLYHYDSTAGLGSATSTAGSGDAAHIDPILFARAHDKSSPANVDAFQAVVFHDDLSESEMNEVAAYMESLV